MIDLRAAADRVAELIRGLTDDDLGLHSPCGTASVGDLIDHLGMFARNFTEIAHKQLDETTSSPPPAFDASNLSPNWRDDLLVALDTLAIAWSHSEAWAGSSWVAGMHLPADLAGVIALDELVIHGWDLAISTGRPYEPAPGEIEASIMFLTEFEAPRDGRLFGPIVDVSDGATPFDQLLGLAGRDPNWTAETRY